MNSTLENKVSRLRKITEMLGELEDVIKPLKEEAAKLQDDIMAEFANTPSLFNVCKRKTVSMGFVGKNLVRIDFGKSLERIDGGRKDDQEWLKGIEASLPICGFIRTKFELNQQKILGDLKGESITEDSLAKAFGLKLGTTSKVKVYRTPEDAAVDALAAEALKLADTIEE